MKFIGVDFGWVSGASGLCCLEWQDCEGLSLPSKGRACMPHQLKIRDITTKSEVTEIFNWIDQWVSSKESALIAVDAPTIIPNQTGARLPDKLTHKYFGKYHAGCYPANLNLPFATRTVGFGNQLQTKGFVHAPSITPQQLGRYQIEVFPHPAIVHLFGLDKILKYKKGKLSEKQQELVKLRNYIATVLPQLEPKLNPENILLLPSISSKITGKELKTIEDQLDSVICAYVAAYWWYWGKEKNLVLGDETTGYIVIPKISSKL
jgi:predicted RNase H-like nuclease